MLAQTPALNATLIPLLRHPKQEIRANAAVWLADRGCRDAAPAMLEVAAKEKSFTPRAALLTAAARLGGDVQSFISPDALLAEERAGLKKSAAKELEWFPFDAMPPLRTSHGSLLDPDVTRWWVVSAAKLKHPGGNAWFGLLLNVLQPGCAARLGDAVLNAWIAYDTARPSEAEANALAKEHCDRYLLGNPRYDEVFADIRSRKLSEYVNSGAGMKGILALATRASGVSAAAVTRTYFRDHHQRTAQCKALLECLAANPALPATQFVVGIARRWRTHVLQELAGTLVQQIAAQRGWSADQLADRTVPTGDFDLDGVLRLTAGNRAYTARIAPNWKIQLYNSEGKPVHTLPSASGGNDAALAEARTRLADARKEVKQTAAAQTARLYEALCAGRAWPAADFTDDLLHHPLLGRLAQRLVWLGTTREGTQVSFRPMEDLTLASAVDTPVDAKQLTSIKLAHCTELPEAELAAWRTHFKDYKIEPLFDQLQRPALLPTPEEADSTEINDRRGWGIDTFRLRSVATKLGYVRGEAEDSGWFYSYNKPFPAAAITAWVDFTGNGLPEERRPAFLRSLRFASSGSGDWRNGFVALKNVPKVLLSEVWNDFHAIAAAGTGFDPAWEAKVG